MRRLITLALWLASTTLAVAQTTAIRTLPEDAKRGHLSHVHGNVVNLDGKLIRLAPGSQIRGRTNLIVLPTALPPQSLVKYKLDKNGDIASAWILTPEEAAKPDQRRVQPQSAPVQAQ
jgi:hypothetical protein